MNRATLVVVFLAVCVMAAHATPPSQITIQGRLSDLGGSPLPAGVKTFTFRIFTDSASGSEIWPGGGEVQSITSGADGLWIGLLGAINPLNDAVFADSVRWLEINVDGTTLPRVRLVTGPYAFRVSTIDGASGGHISGKVSIGTSINPGNHAFAAGFSNVASGHGSIALGSSNTASGSSSSVSGGGSNQASGDYSLIAGGLYNKARGANSAVVGGGSADPADSNSAAGGASFVGGGRGNLASGAFSVVAGGTTNRARGLASFVGGGGTSEQSPDSNAALGDVSAIVGGNGNTTIGDQSFIGAGQGNTAQAAESVIGGGHDNITSGVWSVVPGGLDNQAGGTTSFAAGRQAKAMHGGTFVWADGSIADFSSTLNNQFLIRAGGGVGIGTNAPTKQLEVLDDSAGALLFPLKLTNQGAIAGTATGLIFQVDAGGDRGKGALVYERTSTWNRGDFHFLQEPNIGTTNAGLANKVMTISNNGNIGIGTPTPSNILTVQLGSATDPVADGWGIHSSRRWKDSIETIHDATALIGKLRGVRFTWKADGRPDIGLVAEEVGEIVPEVVAYEDNGVDARAVDYARLVALLIEGMKEQQRQIEDLKAIVAKMAP